LLAVVERLEREAVAVGRRPGAVDHLRPRLLAPPHHAPERELLALVLGEAEEPVLEQPPLGRVFDRHALVDNPDAVLLQLLLEDQPFDQRAGKAIEVGHG
jgi:hypothetical protein